MVSQVRKNGQAFQSSDNFEDLRRRTLTITPSFDASHPHQRCSSIPDVCAKFYTTNGRGRPEVIVLSLDRPVTIGRNPAACTYVIEDRVVSSVHCKLHAVLSSTGGVIVSCEDLSTNGVIINGYKIRRTSAIIMDGDAIQIPASQSFRCSHVLKEPREKTHIFELTPPQGSSYQNLKVAKYTVMSHCLGNGSFASVHLAIDTVVHRQVACKTVIPKAKDKNDMNKLMKEVKILRGLEHPNINRVLDMEVNKSTSWIHIFLELCTGGDLFTYITGHKKTSGRLCEGEAKYIMFQILKGLRYLHDRVISHRDLKPENILLYSPGPYPRIQIADFGLARPKAYQETLNVCGTVAYLPPEGILALEKQELGYVGMPSDCWSSGIILYSMLTGTHPFDYRMPGESQESDVYSLSYHSDVSQATEQVIKSRIVHGHVNFDEEVWESIPTAKHLVARLLTYDHRQRETVYGALRGRWFLDDKNALEQAYRARIGKDIP